MDRTKLIAAILRATTENLECHFCETRLRFGDMECPHCGSDLALSYEPWAESMVTEIEKELPHIKFI